MYNPKLKIITLYPIRATVVTAYPATITLIALRTNKSHERERARQERRKHPKRSEVI